MAIDKRASARWERADRAYGHYCKYIATKARPFDLTLTDLLYVKNFKGGSATIAEPLDTIEAKLERLSRALAGARRNLRKPLGDLSCDALKRARETMVEFVQLSNPDVDPIDGFGPSFTSALLHFHFRETAPILDRRGLSGARIAVDWSNQRQVRDIAEHYPTLIDYCARKLRKRPRLTLRMLDRELFVQKVSR